MYEYLVITEKNANDIDEQITWPKHEKIKQSCEESLDIQHMTNSTSTWNNICKLISIENPTANLQ